MASRTDEFFAELARRGHEPLLAKASGTVHFEIAHGPDTDHWIVSVSKGDVTVSRDGIESDCLVRTDRESFDRFASGQANLLAALLRGELSVEGDMPLAILFQRLLPGPQDPPELRLATADRRRAS
jgi:putative sterol carrier protein